MENEKSVYEMRLEDKDKIINKLFKMNKMLIIGISFAVLVIYLIGYWILTNANDNNEKKKEIVVGAWEEVIIGEEEAPKEEKPKEVPKEGKPILEVIKKKNLNNVVVFVVRYFGGIKLGAGGLIRAYEKTASSVLENK